MHKLHLFSVIKTLCALALVAAAVGCGDQDPSLLAAMDPLDPVALKGSLVFVDGIAHRAFVLDASAKVPQAHATKVELPYGPVKAVRRNGEDEALVLCVGRRSSQNADAEPAALATVSSKGASRVYDLGTTPFDTLVQSDDGRYVVLFRSGEDSSRLLNNANELAIVDLDKQPSDKLAVTHKTPRSFGHTPHAAVFSPPMTIAQEERRLLVVLSEAEVTLIDLNHLDHRETIVQLGGQENRSINPVQVLFGRSDPTLYIRGASTDDIFVFLLAEQTQSNPGGNDFFPSINQLGGGSGPRDMALIGEPQNTRLLVLSAVGAQAVVVDPSSSKATPIALPIPPSHVLLFDGTSPKDKKSVQRAFIYGDAGSEVVFLDLQDVEAKRTRNIETLKLDNEISSIIPLLEQKKLVILHKTGGVSLLDLEQRTVAPIDSSAELQNALFDLKDTRLWVGPAGQPRIGVVDLNSGATDEVLLDANITQLVPLFEIGRLAAVHSSYEGYVTFVDTKDPSRETSNSVRGFLIADVLDRGGK